MDDSFLRACFCISFGHVSLVPKHKKVEKGVEQVSDQQRYMADTGRDICDDPGNNRRYLLWFLHFANHLGNWY